MDMMKMEEQVEQPAVILDEEDTEALLIDCYTFVESVLGRSGNPKWMEKEGHALLQQLAEVLAWHKLQ